MDDQQQLLQKLNRRTRFTLFLVWIALFFTAAGIAAGYKNWLRIHEKAKTGLAGIAEIREEISSFAKKDQVLPLQEKVNSQLKNNKEHTDKALVEIRRMQQSTKHLAESVYEQVKLITQQQESSAKPQNPAIHHWSIVEIRFLLTTAIQVLQLKQDKISALKALDMADKRLLIMGSVRFLPLRKQISQDIALLSQYELPDTAQLSEKITILQQQLQQLAAEKSADNNTKVTTLDFSLKKTKDNNSIINRVKRTINKAVVVRKFDQPLHSEIDAETQENLSQLLSLKLETLRIMLLQKQDKNYHEQLERIKNLLMQYFPEPKLGHYNNVLKELDSVILTPKIPDISASLKLLDSISSTENPQLKSENK